MIELKNIKKFYKMGKIEVQAIKNISLKISAGEFVAIMGPSGSGKSTLLSIIGCLDSPTGGSYFLDGKDVSTLSDSTLAEMRNEKIGFVFQGFNLLPRITAISNVELPLIYSSSTLDGRKQKALKSLETVNLKERANHRPGELSGGEQQRVAIARALVNEPAFILADEPTGNLDSKSGKEIMSILTELNKKGITLIVITHDEAIASYAHRIIKLHDGNVSEDKNADDRANSKQIKDEPITGRLKTIRRKQFVFGEFVENLKMAIFSIFSNKLRSALTMLGIVVGVACVIVMLSLGQGAEAEVTNRIKDMGANLLSVYPGAARRGHARMARGTITTLTLQDADAILETCPHISGMSPSYAAHAQLVYDGKNTNTRVVGTTKEFPTINNFPVETGSFFDDYDNKFMRRVVVLGKTVVRELFDDSDPVGEYVKINRANFQVIGVMATKGGSGWRDQDDVAFVPLFSAQKRLFGVEHLSNIDIQVKNEKLMDKTSKEITELLRQRHKIREGQENDFGIFSQAELLSTVKETTRTFSLLLAGIAIVSLIVGGIGIMNIMLVSVTERTREIGIRKAIGGQRKNILGQFLIEAVVLSLSSGVIGIILGCIVSEIATNVAEWPTVISPVAVILSFTFACAVGLFFGFYPAHKASLLSPMEALRYE